MKRSLFALLAITFCSTAFADKPEIEAVTRGRHGVHNTTGPFGLSVKSFQNVWKQWGYKKRPADFNKQVQLRYGLNPSATQNDGLPLGLRIYWTAFARGVGFNCLLCHSGRIAGQTVIGLGNSSLDLASLFEDIQSNETLPVPKPQFRVARGRGIVEAIAANIAMFQFRDAELNLRAPRKLELKDDLCEDIPAWWHLHRKRWAMPSTA